MGSFRLFVCDTFWIYYRVLIFFPNFLRLCFISLYSYQKRMRLLFVFAVVVAVSVASRSSYLAFLLTCSYGSFDCEERG